jgi:hypothetical protein
MAIRRIEALPSPAKLRSRRGLRAGTTSTSWLPRIARRVPGRSRPSFSSVFICFSAAETNTSTGAPF